MLNLKEVILFLKNPELNTLIEIKCLPSYLKLIWKSFYFIIILDLITGVFITLPLNYFNLLPSLKGIEFDTFNTLKVVLILPIIEESIFRLPLRFSKLGFAFAISLVIYLFLRGLNFINFYIALSSSIVLFLFLTFYIQGWGSFPNLIDAFFRVHFRRIFYLQAILFGALHLSNYNLDIKYFYLFPLIVINYVIVGCFWGYIRVRYSNGTFLCIASHILVNGTYFLVLHYK
jgi:hypothetical protein